MMTHFTVCDADGRILRYGVCPERQVKSQAKLGEFVIPRAGNDETQYVDLSDPDHPGILSRPPFPGRVQNPVVPADGVTAVVLEGLPIPTTVRVESANYLVEDGTLEITFDVPGKYRLECASWPHLDGEFIIEATDASQP